MVRAPMIAMAAVLACATAVRLHFSEALIGRFSILRLSDSAGRPVPIGRSALDPRDQHTVAASIPTRLTRGRYMVDWRVVSVDTHHVQGSYSFTVAR